MTRCTIQFPHSREYPLIRFSYNHATLPAFLVADTGSLRSIIGGSGILAL